MENLIGAVIVTFNSGESVLQTIQSVLPQIHKLCIIDNSSCKETHDVLEIVQKINKNILIIFNNQNLGLGSAYNTGLKLLLNCGCNYFLILDDDSILNNDYVDQMLEASKIKPNSILGGTFYDTNSGINKKYEIFKSCYFIKSNKFKKGFIEVGFVISSGSFLSKDVYQKIGPFKEELFIDYIDIEYSLRAAKNNIKSIIVESAKFCHQMGNATRHKLGVANIVTKNHSPNRRYYIYRNRIVLWRLYNRNIGYLIWDIVAMIYDLLRIISFESSKRKKIRCVRLGLRDGIKNSLGKYPYSN
jgi:rhamnosyltransferase